jgi:hypothetical protein
MKLLAEIKIPRARNTAVIQLLQGDLSALPADHQSDLLVMAAFPGDYTGLRGSLIAALEERGLSVNALSMNKEADLRQPLNCWLSKPLSPPDQKKFNFTRLLCFEPGSKINEPHQVVGDIFRCINNFAFDDNNNVVAMPLIGTGYQRVDAAQMISALLDHSKFWLANGLPIDCLKIIVRSDDKADIALSVFTKYQTAGMRVDSIKPLPASPASIAVPSPAPATRSVPKPSSPGSSKTSAREATRDTANYDFFISYAHAHSNQIQLFVEEMKNQNAGLSVFYDKDSIPPGGLWIQQISAAIQRAKKVIIFLSPDYDNSPVCWDEFQCAKLMEYNRKSNVIQTIYLYSHKETEMPVIMGIYSYIDCREGSEDKIRECARQLIGSLS